MSDALLAIKKAAESRICPSKAAGVYEGQEIPMKNWKWSLGPSTLKLGSQRGRVHGEEGRAVRAGGEANQWVSCQMSTECLAVGVSPGKFQ